MKRTTWLISLTLVLILGMSMMADIAEAADNKKYPVILIHGLASDTSSWKKFPKFLTNKGHDVFVMDFNEWSDLKYADRSRKTIHVIAAVISRQISLVKEITGAEKVNIVAHSIAGLAVRAYIADYGKRIESRGRYNGDINKVVYLSTPFFGFDRNTKDVKQMLKDTDWGPFMDHNEWTNLTRPNRADVLEIHDWFIANRDKLEVEEVTVYSEKDNLVENFSANLDGTYLDPFHVPRPEDERAYEQNKMHVTIGQFDHAYHDLLGRSKKTIIGVGAKNHAVLTIAHHFFVGNDAAWRKPNVNIKNGKGSQVLLRLSKGSGISLSNFKPGALDLYKVKQNKNKRVKMTWMPDAEAFYFEKQKSGIYELAYSTNQEFVIRFDLHLVPGTTQLATFDLNDPPFDEDYDPQPGDMQIKPGSIPAEIKDEADMRRFILASFPFESRTYKDAKGMRRLVGDARELVHQLYPSLIKKGSIDKFGLDQWTTVDWVSESGKPGVLANKLSWVLDIRQPPPPDSGGGGGGDDGGKDDPGSYPTSPPAKMTNDKELKEFVLWYLRGDAYNRSGLKTLAGKVRDKLAQMYSNIERINDQKERHGYTAGWEKHTDAFYDVKNYVIVDFVSGVTGNGAFISKIQWLNLWGRWPW